MTNRTSRLAPSPTGALHLGNARTFLANWALARAGGWRLLMRVEDLDGPRVKRDAARRMLDDLAWLGLDHDEPPTYQSADLAPYRDALAALAAAGRVYPCALTRTQIEAAATAPHAGDHELRFPPSLRPPGPPPRELPPFPGPGDDERATNYRLRVDAGAVAVDDVIAGARTFDPAADVGDFVVWTRRGVPAYQLAVVVDDARQGVTDVVRGDDLLPSAARQSLLYEALGLAPPRWWHLPLVLGPDGRRLAKRHGDTRIATYRGAGVPADRLVGLLAFWSGAAGERAPMSARDFCRRFDAATLPRTPITFTEDDHRWLLAT